MSTPPIPDPSPDPVAHLSPADLAKRWHTSEKRLANLRSLKGGPAYLKIGTRVLYAESAVETYEAAHLVRTRDVA